MVLWWGTVCCWSFNLRVIAGCETLQIALHIAPKLTILGWKFRNFSGDGDSPLLRTLPQWTSPLGVSTLIFLQINHWKRLVTSANDWTLQDAGGRMHQQSPPLQALEACINLATTTERKIVCSETSSICRGRATWRKTLRANKVCALELITTWTCSATERLFVKVTPRIFRVVTRSMPV